MDGTLISTTPEQESTWDRQRSLPLVMPHSVAVVGCGGVGSWTALLLAMSGVKNLYLFDFDVVSESNRNRIPIPPNFVGASKTQSVKSMIALLRPECRVVTFGRFNEDSLSEMLLINNEGGMSWVVATTDSLASRREAKTLSTSYGLAYIEAAAEGDYGSATGAPAEWASEKESQPGYQSVPVWCGPCVVAAWAVVNQILHGSMLKSDRVIRMGFNTKSGTDLFDSAAQPEILAVREEDQEEEDVETQTEVQESAERPMGEEYSNYGYPDDDPSVPF